MSSTSDHTNLLAVYDLTTGKTSYHPDLCQRLSISPAEDRPLWSVLEQNGMLACEEADNIRGTAMTLDPSTPSGFLMLSMKSGCVCALSLVYDQGNITLHLLPLSGSCATTTTVQRDDLTGLVGRRAFCQDISRLRAEEPERPFALFFFDIIRFKAINDLFGFAEGDALLAYIAERLQSPDLPILATCRESSDRFAFMADITDTDPEALIKELVRRIKEYPLPYELNLNVGIYILAEGTEPGDSMLDKAMLAQSAIKGSYTHPIHFYTPSLRDEMLSEQEITGEMNIALAEEQFLIYLQPQYNHSTGMLVGAEALVRWLHPQKGLISPARFIPIFEKNGFISKLDLYVFDKAARFLRRSLDNGYSVVPISVNFSKNDIFSPNFVDTLEQIRTKYDLPAKYLRIEITESILMGNNRAVNEMLERLHACGYIVEMDDFGSGYSSLNVLKDLDFDIIKLDMLFLEDRDNNNRGGTILSSVVNMAKWLNIPVIAEGVETVEQADFLRSIGCDYIQGYLYSKPLPEADYEALVSQSHIGTLVPQMNLVDTLNSANFWDPTSRETLIFSNFVGAAAIFSYNRDTQRVDILRVNQKYLRELGMNLSEHDIIHQDPTTSLDARNHAIYIAMLERAIETGEEQECETWREIRSDCCGVEQFCIRSTVSVIGKSDRQVLFYSMIRNITAEKRDFEAMEETEKRFKMASEQVNIYFWEYTIATREMRPCFRCMRDLGLPPLLRNYPDSAIERGIFPPEVADMYRDWHLQVANGVKELEAVIPLTPDRVPFRVRYTTEFDENGNPIKAYGSAALVV